MGNFSRGELFILYWQYDHSCHLLGNFSKALIKAILTADENNLNRLALGFPEEVAAYRFYGSVDGWWDSLMERAAKDGFPVYKQSLQEKGEDDQGGD